MIFSFRNIANVKEADIEIKGLTIITGINDTGKSVLSKSIFSVIRTIKEAKESEGYTKVDSVESSLRTLQIVLSKISPSLLEKYFLPLRTELTNAIFRKLPNDLLTESVRFRKSEIYAELEIILSAENFDIQKREIDKSILEIEKTINSELEPNKIYGSYFDRFVIQQLFRSQINTIGGDKDLKIICKEAQQKILSVEIKNNRVVSIKVDNPIFYTDAILIDTPIILQLAFFIRQQRIRPSLSRRNDGLPIYYSDLVYKLPSLTSNLNQELNQAIYKSIENVIDGRVVYKEKSDNFVFEKNNGLEIEAANLASGIKSFGLIQLLLASGAINQRSLLIIDEPEVHLHPQWEIAYAKVIADLVKLGINIVISSHSFTFLRSLITFVKEKKLEDVTKFYHGEKEDGLTSFRDVTDNPAPIFQAFSLPMQKLIFEA